MCAAGAMLRLSYVAWGFSSLRGGGTIVHMLDGATNIMHVSLSLSLLSWLPVLCLSRGAMFVEGFWSKVR